MNNMGKSFRIASIWSILLTTVGLAIWLFVGALVLSTSSIPAYALGQRAVYANQLHGIIHGPKPKYHRHGNGVVFWSGMITGDESVENDYPVLLDHIYKAQGGVPLKVTLGSIPPAGAPGIAEDALSRREGYWLTANNRGISLRSSTMPGIARGLARIIDLASSNDGAIPVGRWADWPNFKVRTLQFMVQKEDDLPRLKKIVNIAMQSEFNTLLVLVKPQTVDLSSFGSLSSGNGLSQKNFVKFVKYAKESGLSVVPALKLLTHQELLLGNHYPSLMYNFRTYNPDNPRVYKAVFPIIDQLIGLTGARAFMIGHDEVFGSHRGEKSKLEARGEHVLPSKLFLKDTLALNRHLEELGVTTWMWGDMLESPAEFPNMFASSLHGDVAKGYGQSLLKKLPTNIVLCDWHYWGHDTKFPSLGRFVKRGFKVFGATWKNPRIIKNFSDYAANNGASGMVATTWASSADQLRVIKDVARNSSNQFWNAGETQ